MLSIGEYNMATATHWRVLAGIATALGTGGVVALSIRHASKKAGCCQESDMATKISIGVGTILGLCFGLLTGFLYGIGCVGVPWAYDTSVNRVYTYGRLDGVLVCSVWPDPCRDRNGHLADGTFVDDPALVVNVAHQQRLLLGEGDADAPLPPLKVLLTNTNEKWDTQSSYTKILSYFSTDFNEDVGPGDYLWAPGNYLPYRSLQIFEEFMSDADLDARLEPVPDSNMTTAILAGTTVDSPAFGVRAGQKVEILLLNLNTDIPTYVVGKQILEETTEPLAKMTSSVALNEVLLERVVDFVGEELAEPSAW